MNYLKPTTKNELNRVQTAIKKELPSEKIIQDIYEYIFNTEGKKTRALLSLLSSRSSKIKSAQRIDLASIIELLHTATLVHDDVVDESEVRRGSKSVNQVWTNSYSVLIGDFIYSKAFILMVKLGIPSILDELAKATNDIARGEIIQLELSEKKESIKLNELLKVSYLKTGRLFEAAAKTGAILSSSNKSYINDVSEYAKNLGILFQIRDDLLDYSDSSDIGKPSYQDLKEGKVTYPFYYAYKNANKEEQRGLKNILGTKKLNKSEANKLVSRLNGIKETK